TSLNNIHVERELIEKYAKKELEQPLHKENSDPVNDYIEYIKSNSIITCKLKVLCCLTVMNKSNVDNKLPPIREIPGYINYKMSKSSIHRYIKDMVSKRWIVKINHISTKKQGYRVIISRSKALALYNFICKYEHSKQQDRSVNYKLKQLKKLIGDMEDYELQIEKEMLEDIKNNNKKSVLYS
ncbi:MAG: hypothetical protein ACM3O3_07365, partial [Syntrophothermus sp.]